VIFKVEKRRSRQNGKLRLTRCYYLRYRIGEMPADKWKSLGVTDFQVATKRAQEFVQEREREAAGILEPKLIRDAAQRPLAEHLNDYEADLLKRGRAGRGGRGARLLKSRILRLMKDCGWKLSVSITADSFIGWRNLQTDSARTLNHYLQGMISFLNWMERGGRIKFNPLRNVSKVDGRGQKKRVRRAFTDDELRKLVQGSGPRGIIYFTAARTGLRWEELRQLSWNEVHLDEAVPHVVVRAETAKNKTEESVCLVPEIVEALMEYRSANESTSKLVFPNGIPRTRRLQKDAKANGIDYKDELGRFADFHALRYTWATFLQRNGIAQRFAMKLMRHSDIKLTSKVYTDESQLPIYDSIKNLPRLEACTQIRAQISGAEGQNGAQPVASSEGVKPHESPVNGGLCPVLSLPVANSEVERAKGIEPSFLKCFKVVKSFLITAVRESDKTWCCRSRRKVLPIKSTKQQQPSTRETPRFKRLRKIRTHGVDLEFARWNFSGGWSFSFGTSVLGVHQLFELFQPCFQVGVLRFQLLAKRCLALHLLIQSLNCRQFHAVELQRGDAFVVAAGIESGDEILGHRADIRHVAVLFPLVIPLFDGDGRQLVQHGFRVHRLEILFGFAVADHGPGCGARGQTHPVITRAG